VAELGPQLTGDDNFATLSTPCTLEQVLAEINGDGATCTWTTLSGDSLFDDHPFGRCWERGVVHYIIHVIFGPYPDVCLGPNSDEIADIQVRGGPVPIAGAASKFGYRPCQQWKFLTPRLLT